MDFKEAYVQFLREFGAGRPMVVSTSLHDRVTSRMLSVVLMDGKFYFQTDKTFRKYHQIKGNPNIALCIDNIQVEGRCEETGTPMENAAFCEVYRACFRSSFERYSPLENERVFAVTPTFIERWHYINGVPYIETFELENEIHTLTPYGRSGPK